MLMHDYIFLCFSVFCLLKLFFVSIECLYVKGESVSFCSQFFPVVVVQVVQAIEGRFCRLLIIFIPSIRSVLFFQ